MTGDQCARYCNQLKQQRSRNKPGIQIQGLSCPTSWPQGDLSEMSFPGDPNAGPCPCEILASHLLSVNLFPHQKMGLSTSSQSCPEHQLGKWTCSAKPRPWHSPAPTRSWAFWLMIATHCCPQKTKKKLTLSWMWSVMRNYPAPASVTPGDHGQVDVGLGKTGW